MPFVWTFLSSGEDVGELYRIPPTLWPAEPRFALPCLILFFLAQKYFVQGIVMSGIKG